MGEMIERVAKAINEAADGQVDGCLSALAYAAIEAMREPTEAMIEAAFRGHAPPGQHGEQNARETFARMIDAALKDTPPS